MMFLPSSYHNFLKPEAWEKSLQNNLQEKEENGAWVWAMVLG